MRVHVLSDLHLEFGPFDLSGVDADLVVLAGDIHTKLNGIRWIRETLPDTTAIYLAGNHEYYGEKLPRLLEKIRDEAQGTRIHLLENNSVEFGGYRFFGASLWTDFDLFGDHHVGMHEALRMNDYKRIRKSPSYRKLLPSDTRMLHHMTVRELSRFLDREDNSRSIVITHHAPSRLSLPASRKNDPLSCAYASNLDDLIGRHRPLLWIHGHIHESRDYRIGPTRILCNPRAYVDEPNPSFDPRLVIDLEQQQRDYLETINQDQAGLEPQH